MPLWSIMWVVLQEKQQLQDAVKDKKEQLSLAQQRSKDLHAQLLTHTQAEYAAQRDLAALKVRLQTLKHTFQIEINKCS